MRRARPETLSALAGRRQQLPLLTQRHLEQGRDRCLPAGARKGRSGVVAARVASLTVANSLPQLACVLSAAAGAMLDRHNPQRPGHQRR